MARLSPVLQQYLQRAQPGDLVEVVLEMHDQPSPEPLPTERRERSQARDQQFTRATQAVVQIIQSAGGTVLGSSWLSSAIKIRIPAGRIEGLLTLDRIDLIDLPRKLTR